MVGDGEHSIAQLLRIAGDGANGLRVGERAAVRDGKAELHERESLETCEWIFRSISKPAAIDQPFFAGSTELG
jgi:hypothetical protein